MVQWKGMRLKCEDESWEIGQKHLDVTVQNFTLNICTKFLLGKYGLVFLQHLQYLNDIIIY